MRGKYSIFRAHDNVTRTQRVSSGTLLTAWDSWILSRTVNNHSNSTDPFSMDLIQQCLQIRPPTHLTVAFSWFQSIALSLQNLQASQERFMFLGRCIAQTLQALVRNTRSGALSAASTAKAVSDFSTWVPLEIGWSAILFTLCSGF